MNNRATPSAQSLSIGSWGLLPEAGPFRVIASELYTSTASLLHSYTVGFAASVPACCPRLEDREQCKKKLGKHEQLLCKRTARLSARPQIRQKA